MPRFGAIDIGSNSIRMLVAETSSGEPPRLLDEDREVTRLGQSVFRDSAVSPEAIDQSCRVLRRMTERLNQHQVVAFRAVATSAIRDAKNQQEFLEKAQLALGGVSAEVVSGREEARLIHLGVQSRSPDQLDGAVIVDIGGGSAEVIESHASEGILALSKPLGAVRLTELFFQADPPSRRSLQQFEEFVAEKSLAIRRETSGGPYSRVIVTAATAAAVARAVHKIPSSDRDGLDGTTVSTDEVRELFGRLVGMNLRQRRALTGIGPRRAEVIIAGCGVLLKLLETLQADEFRYSVAGVRDGIIADLAARSDAVQGVRLHADQSRAVRQMAARCEVEPAHADRVAELAVQLFEALRPLHGLDATYGGLLEAAAHLHDVGHFVSDSKHHRHSEYLVVNSDIEGFTNAERRFVASLCRYHRRSMPRETHESFSSLSAGEQQALVRLIPLLRIADSLDRGHRQVVQSVVPEISDAAVTLTVERSADASLEEWAVDNHSEVFLQVYGRRLIVAGLSA